jgi:hypothetical protein
MWYGDSAQFVWWRVVGQIILVQIGFWALLGLWIVLLDVVLAVTPQVRYI